MRLISWTKLVLVLAVCFTGFATNAQVIKQTKKPLDDDGGSNCEPYVYGYLTPNPPNPNPNSNYRLEMSFDIGGFDDINFVKEIFFAIDVIDNGASKPYVLDYDCCIPISHGPSNDNLYDYHFNLLDPGAMADAADCDDSFFVSDCGGISLTEDIPTTGDQMINYPDNNPDDPDGVDCPGIDIDIINFGGGLVPNCNVHRIEIVYAYYKDGSGVNHPITQLYGDQVCIGNCNYNSSCNAPAYRQTELEADVKIYPNPVREELNVELLNINEADVKIFNINGELVYTQLDVTKEELLVDVSEYSQGIYIVSVENETGTFQKKFTKL